jgi:predicted PurR-regulated permease PerM
VSVSVSTRSAARLVLVVLLTTLAFFVALWLVYELREIVVWSIVALFLAVALNPAVDWLSSRRLPRGAAILLSYLGLLIVVAAVGYLVVPSLALQAGALVHALRQPGGLTAEVNRVAGPLGLEGFVRSLRPQIDALPGQVAGSIGSFTTVTASTVSTITGAASIVVLAFFFLHDGAGLVDGAVGLLPDAHQPRARRLVDKSADAIFGYIRGNLAISAIAGTSALAGMLVLGIPYALPLAVLLAVLDLVPMVGATLGAIPVVLAALTVSPIKAVIILAYIIVYQQIESNVLNPLIYGRSDQLPALAVFLAFLAASLLWGILGALIAVPAANIIRIVIREWQATRAGRSAEAADTSAGQAAALQSTSEARAGPDTAT